MLYVDALSAYLNCGVSSLVGAAMLRIAETDDRRLQEALRVCGWALVILGLGLLPAGLGERAGHPLAQFSLGFGSLGGVLLMACGLGQVQGHIVPLRWLWIALALLAGACAATLALDRLVFGQTYALGLALTTTLMAWLGRGFVASPRDVVERGLGLSLLMVAASSWARAAFTLAYVGPPHVNMLYVPSWLAPVLAALYGVVPIVMATLLLSLVNARLRQQLRSQAFTDELTGILTRRALREVAPPMMAAELHHQREVAVLILDLDHFKVINDTYGHTTGDKVLRTSAAILQEHLRHDSLLARYGGEEFVAVVPVQDMAGARRVAERLRQAIECTDWEHTLELKTKVTISVGASLLGLGECLDAAIQRADEALYRAKREGRNQVQVTLMVA